MVENTPDYRTVSKVFHSVKPPYGGLIVDIVRFTPTAYTLRLYRDNFETFSEGQKVAFAEWLNTVLQRMNMLPIQVALEMFESVQ
jgi:hypothetical protein